MTNENMTPERLEAIRQRVEKATQGPWNFEGNKWQDGYVIYSPIKRGFHNNGGEVAEVDDSYEPSDAEFIANARQDIPDLLAEVERLRYALESIVNIDGWYIDRDFDVNEACEKVDEIAKEALSTDD